MKAHFTAGIDNIGGSLSAGGEDLYALLKAQEEAKGRSWRPIQAYSLYVTDNARVSINGDTDDVFVPSGQGLSGTGELTSLVLNTAGIEYSFVAEY